jgi:hypothetical protein
VGLTDRSATDRGTRRAASRAPPVGYRRHGTLDLSRNRTAGFALAAASTVLLVVFGWLSARFVGAVRPEAGPIEVRIAGEELPLLLAGLAAVTLAVVLVHEGLHGLCFWLVTGERPRFGLRGLYAYAGAPGWYVARNRYLPIALAPLVAITLGGLLLLTAAPARGIPALVVALALNAAGAVGDLAVVAWLLTRPGSTLVHDSGEAVTLYQPEDEPADPGR